MFDRLRRTYVRVVVRMYRYLGISDYNILFRLRRNLKYADRIVNAFLSAAIGGLLGYYILRDFLDAFKIAACMFPIGWSLWILNPIDNKVVEKILFETQEK